MKATLNDGSLRLIEDCYLDIPNYRKIVMNNLPDITDSKGAVYNADAIIGRSSPLHTYSHSDTRNISVTFHYYIIKNGDATKNLEDARAICSCAYPRQGGDAPFIPPIICKFRCGSNLATSDELCLILQNYQFQIPTDVAWDADTYCPYRFDLSTTWWVVYASEDLPFASNIIKSGR